MIAQSSNRLLAALPADEYRRLMPELHTIHLRNGEGLPHCGETRVYFPERGICSVANVMDDGRMIEIATVGSEGVVGMTVLAGLHQLTRNSYTQIGEGSARFMLIDGLSRELARSGTLRRLVDRFSRGLLESIIQSAACNRLHTVQQRCVRWLLSVQDRVGRAQFELTHEVLANALGVKRSKMVIVLKRLEKLNAVEVAGGLVTLHRKALERLACDCYPRFKRHREDALPLGAALLGGRANVVHLVPDVTCARCQSGVGLPHPSEHECITAIDAELRVLSSRTACLHSLRKVLVDQRLRTMREYLEKARARLSS
jgi:CRP-like cAMP-binding protein